MSGDDMATRGDERPTGWHADPFGRHESRWWDGQAWTEKIRTDRAYGIDPVGVDPAPVAISEPAPAHPIDDALLPIKRPKVADRIAIIVSCLVFLALVAVFVVAMTA